MIARLSRCSALVVFRKTHRKRHSQNGLSPHKDRRIQPVGKTLNDKEFS